MKRKSVETDYKYVIIRAIPFLVSFVFVILCILFAGISYETNDDLVLNMIAAGAYGETQSPYMIYSNICYGWLLNVLYQMIPGINWYFWIVITANMISAGVIGAVLSDSSPSVKWSLAVSLAVNLVLAREFFLSLQFTKNAALYSLVGGIMLYRSWRFGGQGYRIPVGSAFVLLGILIRKESAVFVIPFVVLLILLSLRHTKMYHRLLLAFLPLIVVSGFFLMADRAAYRGPEWEEYKDTFPARSVLFNSGGRAYYPEHAQEYQQIGISENAVEMMKSWVYMDPDYFTVEKWKEIERIIRSEQNTHLRLNLPVIRTAVREMLETTLEQWIPKLFWIIAAGGLIIIPGKMKLIVSGVIGGVCAGYWYFACINRFQWRAELVAWLAGILCMAVVISAQSEKILINRKIGSIVLLFLVAVCLIWLINLGERYQRQMVKNDTGTTALNHSDDLDMPNDAFFVGTKFDSVQPLWRITRTDYSDAKKNYCSLGGWVAGSPVGMHFARENGIINPIRALVEKEHVFLQSNEKIAEMIRIHLEEVYGESVYKVEIAGNYWDYGFDL